MDKMNEKLLKQLAGSSNTARLIFSLWAQPEKRRREKQLELARFIHNELAEEAPSDVYRFFKELERITGGKLIVGARLKPLRFKSRYHFKDMGLAAVGVQENMPVAIRAGHAQRPQVKSQNFTVTINTDGTITIPQGISLTEVARLLKDAVA